MMTSVRVEPSVLLVCVLAAATAHAGPSPADVAFKKGREFLKAGKFAEACAAFEDSQRLDPQLGTQFNIAHCDEKIGKIATAWAIYRDLADHDTNGARQSKSAKLADALWLRLPKLKIEVVDPPKGLVVTLDGGDITADLGKEQPVDSGSHAIEASGTDVKPWHKDIEGVAGNTTPISIRLEPTGEAAARAAHEQQQPQHGAIGVAQPTLVPAHSARKKVGIAVTIVGGVAVATGMVFGSLASSKWTDAKAVCGGTVCPDQTKADQASSLASTARGDGNLSTIFVVGGAVAAVAGVVLWVTAPSWAERGVAIAPHASEHEAGLTLSGQF